MKRLNNRAITLIALVITIIVLLILAGVTIATLTGDNGILARTTQAKKSTVVANEKEAISLAWQALEMKNNGKNTNIEASELETQLHSDGKKTVCVTGTRNLIVTYSDTGHSYVIAQEGNIISEDLEEISQVVDSNPGEFNGNGEQESPYLIESIEDLVALATNVNSGQSYEGKYFELTKTLDFNLTKSYVNPEEKYAYDSQLGGYVKDLNGEAIKTLCTSGEGFIPIGISKSSTGFKGDFEGNDCSIKNLYIYRETAPENMNNYVGLFGMITDSTIQNLTLTGQILAKDTDYVGSFVGYGNFSKSKCFIKNCYSKVNIECQQVFAYIGGIVGCIYGSVEYCTNDGDIIFNNSEAGCIGGIVGICCNAYYDSNDIIKNCINNGNITVSGQIAEYQSDNLTVGGVSGYNNGTSVQECTNNGNISGEYIHSTYAGGISGYNDSWEGSIVNIKDSTNNGSVKGISTEQNAYVGGIAGYSEKLSIIENSTNKGSLEVEAPNGTTYKNDIVGYQEQ